MEMEGFVDLEIRWDLGIWDSILQWASVTHGGVELHVATYVLYDVEYPSLHFHCFRLSSLTVRCKR